MSFGETVLLAFQSMDSDKDGYIRLEEMKSFLHKYFENVNEEVSIGRNETTLVLGTLVLDCGEAAAP